MKHLIPVVTNDGEILADLDPTNLRIGEILKLAYPSDEDGNLAYWTVVGITEKEIQVVV